MAAMNNESATAPVASQPAAPQVCIVTMGCAKNEVDSQEMTARLETAGYRITDQADTADAVIVNTCSFIRMATEESLDAIFAAAGMDNVASGRAHLIVSGCMPARYGDDLAGELSEVEQFVPCSREDDIVAIMDGVFGDAAPAGARDDAAQVPYRPLADQSPWTAYVRISDGCDRFCSYCTIPYIRGRYHSYPEADIMADTRRKVDAGVREITLIAQDTGRWGTDFDELSSLGALMDHLATAFPDTWFRVMYIQPEGINDELLDAMAAHDNICSYLDIPVQHSAAHLLKAMNRKGSPEEYLALLDHVRAKVPGVTLRTTVIAGYPGETPEDVDDLCDFLEEAAFDYVGVFAYSREDGTRAAKQPDQVPEEEKLDRAQQVRDAADAVSATVINQRVGRMYPVLLLGREDDGQLFGRAMCQAPDVDGVTFTDEGEPGEIRNLTITDTLMYEMEGD
jgi:ribosomal protein S12 methylthiotransferase